jgi:hypothetical protein
MDTAMTAYLLASEQDPIDVDLYGAGAPRARRLASTHHRTSSWHIGHGGGAASTHGALTASRTKFAKLLVCVGTCR